MRRMFAGALAALALAACSGAASPVAPAGHETGARKTMQARFFIKIPRKKIAVRSTHGPRYISTNTSSVQVTVALGTQSYQTTIACTYSACSGNVTAPIGNDTFTAALMDAHGDLLSEGVAQQTIAPGANSVSLTFDPVVASVTLAMDVSTPPPYLSAIGPSSVPITVTIKDASGATIVGPGMFVTAGNPSCQPTVATPCLTVTLNDSDTSGATQLSSPSSFTSASGAISTTLSLTGTAAPPFDDPNVTVTATGVSNLSGIDVPVSPVIDWVDNLSGFPGTLTSLNGNEDTSWQYGGDAGVNYNIATTTDTRALDPASQSVGFLTSGTSDDNLWLFEDNNDPTSGVANELGYFNPIVHSYTGAAYPTFEISTMTAGGDGNLWFGESGALGAGRLVVSPVGTLQTLTFNAHPGAQVEGLVSGASTAMIAVVSDGANTWLETLTPALGPPVEVEVSPSIKGVNVAGFSHADGNLYLADATSTHALWKVNPTSGAAVNLGATNVAAATTIAATGTPQYQAMAELSSIDGSLVYVGQYEGGANVFVHVVPGRKPNPFSIVFGQPDASTNNCINNGCEIDGTWYVSPSGAAETTDGGNLRFMAFHG